MPEQIGTASVRDRTASQVVCLQKQPGSVTKHVKWRGLTLQIPASRLRPHFCARHCAACRNTERRLAIFPGPHRLAHYDRNGNLCDDRQP